MPRSSEKETRIMKVTMHPEEFAKFDKGITHSNSGLRNEKGHMSVQPDIAPVSDEDLPLREIVRTETIYVDRDPPRSGLGPILVHAFTEAVTEVLSDPEVQEGLAKLGKAFWYY